MVEVPRGHYAELTFIDVNVDSPANRPCTEDNFVEIRDVNETGSSHLLSLLSRVNTAERY